jgi:murein DD-endopeptidase MepM/ murein hydrolase activator NlpD
MGLQKRERPRWDRFRDYLTKQYQHHFPERQIYFRSRGVVRFVSLSPRFQSISLAVAFTITCWVGIASANLVFGNQVIERKDKQIADLREIRGDLHKQLVTLQDDILNRTQTLQQRQEMIDGLLARSKDAMLGNLPGKAIAQKYPSFDTRPGAEAPLPIGGPDDLDAPVLKPLPARTPDMRKKEQQKLPIVLRGEQQSSASDPLSEKLSELEGMQDVLILRMDTQVRSTIDRFEQALKIAGLTTEKVLAGSRPLPANQGGPYLPLVWNTFDNEDQNRALISLMQNVDRLSALYKTFERAPLALPVDDFYISSTFGGRRDPFNNAPSFHSGVDLGSQQENAPIYSTAPGKVTFAGRDGPYGLMVEIDHGNGFVSRYGHMKNIVVRQGQRVALREVVGVMGSTGRSTGTHLHYEVRFNGTLLNPVKIFKAAQHVQAI